MKRIIFALLLLPQLAYSQYRADCFRLDLSDNVSQVKIGKTFDRDTTLSISERTTISGLSISGTAVMDNDNNSYVRVTLVDNYNYEFLVYENYPTLSDDLTTKFTNIALETVLLDDITPQCLKISVLNATIELDTISYSNASAYNRQSTNNPSAIQKAQTQYIVDKLNTNLERRNMTWRAGVTSISEKTYSEKKDMFGGTVPELYGFEHYVGGVFVVPGNYLNSLPRSTSSSEYISEWDWRNRHGRNWMTSVKNQGNCGSCWAHAAVGIVESYVSLYYNRLINPNLSEQEIIACKGIGCHASYENVALKYIKNNGVVNEQCFPYHIPDSMSCWKKCNDPDTLVFINDYKFVTTDVDSIKKSLFNNPLTITVGPWTHSMVLVGYKRIALGDVIYLGDQPGHNNITIDGSYTNYLNKNAWLIKNSWGNSWGNNGYGYVMVNNSNIWRVLTPTGNVTCNILNDSNIVCEDVDGDGYYFWGLSDTKPSYCPSWVPDIKDGNDANYSKGKLLLENTSIIGELETLNPNGNSTLVISGNITYTTRQSKYSHIRITSGGKLTVKNILNLFGRVTVTIESGGELVVDGGVVTNTSISLSSGGKITLKNGGKMVMRTNTDFAVPTGALADITHGEILRSNDF